VKQTLIPWSSVHMALTMLALDPKGLGGIWARARSGPVRDHFTQDLARMPLPVQKLHPNTDDVTLFGGLDLTATLAKGSIVQSKGVLATPSTFVLTMAERTKSEFAARLSLTMDDIFASCLVALDESTEEEDGIPSGLADRLAFHFDFDGYHWADTTPLRIDAELLRNAKFFLPKVVIPDGVFATLVVLALKLGISSMRAPLMAAQVARLHAALSYRATVAEDDIKQAVQLVLAPRATQLPEVEQDEALDNDQPPAPPPEDDTQDDSGPTANDDLEIPAEILLAAVRAVLPADVLAQLATQKTTRAQTTGSGSGDAQKGNRRGRPLPARQGNLDSKNRIDLVATLRAAAPWQPIRRKLSPRGQDGPALLIAKSDIRTKRYESKSDRLLIFTVDASGSAAMTRLNEAKGAVELLLAQAYARRDHVALVSFRGDTADILLQPTRSLVQTKRQLAALPGGGGTPLASGIKAALELAFTARTKGMTPTIALLTDGRANIALDGSANRKDAASDAATLGQSVRSQNISAIVIDMGNRPERQLEALADSMNAPYIPLPRANAERLSTAVSVALDG